MIKMETTNSYCLLSVYILKVKAQKLYYDTNIRQRGTQEVLSTNQDLEA